MPVFANAVSKLVDAVDGWSLRWIKREEETFRWVMRKKKKKWTCWRLCLPNPLKSQCKTQTSPIWLLETGWNRLRNVCEYSDWFRTVVNWIRPDWTALRSKQTGFNWAKLDQRRNDTCFYPELRSEWKLKTAATNLSELICHSFWCTNSKGKKRGFLAILIIWSKYRRKKSNPKPITLTILI